MCVCVCVCMMKIAFCRTCFGISLYKVMTIMSRNYEFRTVEKEGSAMKEKTNKGKWYVSSSCVHIIYSFVPSLSAVVMMLARLIFDSLRSGLAVIIVLVSSVLIIYCSTSSVFFIFHLLAMSVSSLSFLVRASLLFVRVTLAARFSFKLLPSLFYFFPCS